MWGGTEPDPGGENTSEVPVCNQELKDLKDQFDQQQVLIAQLKEMLRKSEQTAVMQEKVEEYANTLTRMNARVKKSKLKREFDVTDTSSISIDTPAKEKILLLRQQMEENKLKLAERGKLHKGIEETVTQMKAQLDDSQHIISQASINVSLIDPKDENYSINSSQEELFNYLVAKDRRIGDLNAKIQKLEASVLDLQENVKEKDSVIDARTKAITLMTDSLSRKGKNTLDALDDTKDQMRKMQENFVNLEAELKNEKQLLVEQLQVNSAETERLQKLCNDQNEELQRLKNESSPKKGRKGKKGQKVEQNECEHHLTKIAQHESTINELNLTIEELKAVQAKPKEAEQPENLDVSKLKKQLDENNKSMIKIKAQHKGKIKELNKTIEELKKDQGGAAEIQRLQEENAKLNEQVLKLSSNHDLTTSERVNDLEMKLLQQSELVETKNQTISTLEDQIALYKSQVEQLEKFSRLENDQVASEIQSIDFEEQLDKVQVEKAELQVKYDEVNDEKLTLLETIDNLTKEKQEISSKLDNYIQENIELIDKLEKLSSAKVSSAESIEIVEGLTQQEKLELEEYQKGLEIPENVKNSVENLESPGLNESVNQLTEETSDLLRKIELFTEERREVMDKMEALALENSQLNIKICEVENNRDILAETYEQVQNEKEDLEAKLEQEKLRVKELESSLLEKITILQNENKTLQEKINSEPTSESPIVKNESFASTSDLQDQINEYKALIEIQKQEIHQLKLELLSQQNLAVAHSNLQDEIALLQARYQTLMTENEALAKTIKNNSEVLHEKDALESELRDARKRINEFVEKLNENVEEIENYKSILDENKDELISSANIINDLQNKVHVKHIEVQHYEMELERLNTIITDLSSRISDIENESAQSLDNMETMEIMSNQLQELKEILNENIKQIEKYEGEIETNSNTIGQLTLQLKELKSKLDNMQTEIESKNDEITKLVDEQKDKDALIAKLKLEINVKDQNFHGTCQKLKEKCLALQSKIDEHSGSLDKLNLSKVEEFELKNKEQLEKMKKIAASLKKKNIAYQELEQKYKELDNKHKALNIDIITKIQEIEQLNVQNAHLRNLAEEAELQGSNDCNDLNLEINRKNDLIKTLTIELDGLRYSSETNTNALHVKIQELEMFIESQDGELNKYKEQVDRLEEGLSALEERRQSLERQAVELGNQLQEKSNSYEEISQIEDILEQRLATLMAQDKKMEKRLRDSTVENQKLQESSKYLLEENDHLKQKLAHAIERKVDADKVLDMEQEIQRLKEMINKMEHEHKHHSADYEKKLMEKSMEVENMEVELQGQLLQLNGERKALIVQCEQLNDQIKEHLDTQELLRENVEDYKNKLNQQQIEYEAHFQDCRKLEDENKSNLVLIDKLNSQIGEIENLNKLLIDKNTEIGNYQLQNDQLQSSNCSLQEQYDLVCKKINNLEIMNSDLLEKVTQLNKDGAPSDSIPESTSEQNVTRFVWPEQTSDNPFESIMASQSYQNEAPLFVHTDESKTFNFFDTLPVGYSETKEAQSVESQTFLSNQSVDTQTTQKTLHDVESMTEQNTEIENLVVVEENEPRETREELVGKIKTLEFMLFNIEKEKEDALYQCQELSTQIAQLIYEKEICLPVDEIFTPGILPVKNITHENKEEVEPDIVSQIVSLDDAQITHDDLQQLQCIEFGKYEQNKENDDVCEAKSAYLCFPVDTKTLESQIVTNKDADVTKENLRQLKNIEFTKCKELKDVVPQTSAVSETAESKTAYLCFKSDDTFDENDDGWGCGSDEAKLEADYHQQQQVDHNIAYVSELKKRICSLEMERDKYHEDNKQAQIKSGKLVKKLKEYKALNEKLEGQLRKTGEFSGLDDALQDEFKAQIAQLEKRVKEIALELEKERNYKNNVSKQLDMLQAANERMVEMKEKQDFEMLTWQRQNRELSSKLEQFEWGHGDSESPKHERQPDDKINELLASITELTKDNEELQILLDEQRNLRIAAEKTKIEVVPDDDYLSIIADKNSLKDELANSIEEKKMLQDQLNNLIKINDNIQEQFASTDKTKLELEKQIVEKNQIIAKHTEELKNLQAIIADPDNKYLKNLIQELRDENMRLVEERVKSERDLQEFKVQFVASHERQIIEFAQEMQLKTRQVLEITRSLEGVLEDKSSLTESIQMMTEDWNEKVDQRGFEVAESWKLHLETRETEFLRAQETLQKEINELEEKCNALVNENNELRKNVDAEIRNEVDKISALQQQINDRQQYINDLSRIVQEKQLEIEQLQLKINEYDVAVQQINDENTAMNIKIVEKEQTILEIEAQLVGLSDLKKEMRDNNELFQKLQLELEDKQKLLDESALKVTQSNQELNEYKEAIDSFQQQIESKDSYISELAGNAHENQTQVNLLNEELKNKIDAICKLEASVQAGIDATIELKDLKTRLSEKEEEVACLNSRLQELEMTSAKNADVENVKLLLLEAIQNNNILKDEYAKVEATEHDLKLKLEDKIQECKELSQMIYEQDLLHNEENKQISELSAIIEDQVFRIEAQKQELYEKSKDYDSLIAELDIRKPSLEHVPVPPTMFKENQVQESSSTHGRINMSLADESLNPISRPEHDLALYMLHQRDVRCEELTVELMQLLEERDTLQLKLSNAIREKEDLRKKYLPSLAQTQSEDLENSNSSNSPSKVSAIVLGASGTEIGTEAIESPHPLTNKLLELKAVGYGRDKTLLDEQERRRYQQLALMQEHRDLAALLPPEAAAKLVEDANYTLSRDVQSPSKVLLNWLWGRSTPKVNNV